MKSRLYILILLLLIGRSEMSFACLVTTYTPKQYPMYRVSAIYDHLLQKTDNKTSTSSHLALWKNLTGQDIPLAHIQEVVYSSDLALITQLTQGQNPLPNNKFAQWAKADQEVLDYLLLAKECETLIKLKADPWYYPTEADGVKHSLATIIQKAKAYAGEKLKNRYELQAMRAMFAAKEYEACMKYWDKIKDHPIQPLFKQMLLSYVAGAEFQVGDKQKAIDYYMYIGDEHSLKYCYAKLRKTYQISLEQKIETLYRFDPESEDFTDMLQHSIRKYEDEDWDVYNYYKVENVGRLIDLVLRIAKEGKVKNVAMWYYTAAFLMDHSGKTTKAKALLATAEKQKKTSPLIAESIQGFRIYLSAKTSPLNRAYEAQLYHDLKWLDDKITLNLDDKLKEFITSRPDLLSSNRSCFYWNDLARRIILAELIPRMLENKNITRAIQLYNYIDSRFMRPSYGNETFAFVDSLKAREISLYVDSFTAYDNSLQNLLNERSNTNLDFWNDILGTKYLQEMNYPEAAKYLKKVPGAFELRLNTSPYMKYNPFEFDQVITTDKGSYKYRFAKTMMELEQEIQESKDPNTLAFAMLRYAVGLKNSFERCWPLTRYYDGNPYGYVLGGTYLNSNNPKIQASLVRARRTFNDLHAKSFALFTDDECRAQALLSLRKRKEVMTRYGKTKVAARIRYACDEWKDY